MAETPLLRFEHEIEPQPGKRRGGAAKRCSYCKHGDGTHSKTCKRKARAGACSCGGVKRHKPGCGEYRGAGKNRRAGGGTSRAKAKTGKVATRSSRPRAASAAANGSDPIARIRTALEEIERDRSAFVAAKKALGLL